MNLSKYLLDTRQELNLSQKQLADILGLDEKQVWQLEFGEPLWSTETIEKKARRLIRDYKHNRT